MIVNRVAIIALTSAALALPAIAQDRVNFDDLDADRLNPRQVLIEFDYQGGACEEVGEAQLGDITDGTLAVTFALSNTSEVCTMQLVKHEIKEAVQAGPEVTHVDVTLLDPEGEVMAQQKAKIDED